MVRLNCYFGHANKAAPAISDMKESCVKYNFEKEQCDDFVHLRLHISY